MTEIQHKNPVVSVRLPDLTRKQIDELTAKWGCSMANLITVLVDRAYQQETRSKATAPDPQDYYSEQEYQDALDTWRLNNT